MRGDTGAGTGCVRAYALGVHIGRAYGFRPREAARRSTALLPGARAGHGRGTGFVPGVAAKARGETFATRITVRAGFERCRVLGRKSR